MARYRKKPLEIDAFQWLGELESLWAWVREMAPNDPEFDSIYFTNGRGLFCRTLEGHVHVSAGDWIIRGVRGEFYPCKPHIFEATYEAVGRDREDR